MGVVIGTDVVGPERRDWWILSGSAMEHCPEEGTFLPWAWIGEQDFLGR